MYYVRKKDEIWTCLSPEEHFKLISFSMVEQLEEQVTYSKYSEIFGDNLISIAEELLKDNQNLFLEFNKKNPNDDFLKRVNESIGIIIHNYRKKIAEELATTLTPVTTKFYQFFSKLDFTLFRGALYKINNRLSCIAKVVNEIMPPDFIEVLREYNETAVNAGLELKIVMLENGWVNALTLEGEHIFNILVKYMEEYDLNIYDVVNVFMTDLYTEKKIKEVIVRWKKRKWLKKRYHILKSAINAHVNGEYALTVPIF